MQPPIWDLQFADDIVLMTNSGQLANCLLHGVQRHGYRFGLELNLEKCEHLALHSPEHIYTRTGDDVMNQCTCEHCGGEGVGHPLKQVKEATYLGAQLTPDGAPDHFVLSRLRKANAATKALASFFSASFLSPAFRLRVCQSIVQSILLYSIESVVPTPAQHQRMDALHFPVLRQILNLRSSFFQRVLQPSDSPCSNNHLHTLANSHGINIYTPSQIAATRRLQLLGHLLRHETCTEHLVSFMPSHAYRFLWGENLRQGRPRPHWAELVLTEAQFIQQQTLPALTDLSHPFFSPPTATVTDWRATARIYWPVREAARSRALWRNITGQYPKPVPQSPRRPPLHNGWHYTMEFQLRTSQSDLSILLLTWGF